MKYKRIELPYGYDKLEPAIDATTVETHYEKHHKAYESKFNEAVAGTEVEEKFNSIEEVMLNFNNLPEELKNVTKNAGGGLINHNFYFNQFSDEYKVDINELEASFGSIEELKSEIVAKGLAVFGSGWVWLVKVDNEYKVITTPNQENPWMQGITEVIIGIDVWEHAYYLKYKQDRKTYIEKCLEMVL